MHVYCVIDSDLNLLLTDKNHMQWCYLYLQQNSQVFPNRGSKSLWETLESENLANLWATAYPEVAEVHLWGGRLHRGWEEAETSGWLPWGNFIQHSISYCICSCSVCFSMIVSGYYFNCAAFLTHPFWISVFFKSILLIVPASQCVCWLVLYHSVSWLFLHHSVYLDCSCITVCTLIVPELHKVYICWLFLYHTECMYVVCSCIMWIMCILINPVGVGVLSMI